MEPEERQLLIKDILPRLPYGVKVAVDYKRYLEWLPEDDGGYRERFQFFLNHAGKSVDEVSLEPVELDCYPCGERFGAFRMCHEEYCLPVDLLRPYLRPVESMTDEENKELMARLQDDSIFTGKNPSCRVALACSACVEYFNENMFDYRGLIEKGLAIEAPANMYLDNE